MKPKKKAVVAGHICLDVLPEMTHLPAGQFAALFQPGHLITVGEALFATGGPVSNVGLALHILGIPTRLIAKIGDDPYGDILQQIISGFDQELLDGVRLDSKHPTSYSVIISPPGVDRIFLHCPGVNDNFDSSDIDYDMLADADLMHFGYPPIMRQMYRASGAELVKIFQHAKQTGITTSLDMAFPDPASPGGQVDWRQILSAVLPSVDIFTPSIEEILFMLHGSLYHKLLSGKDDIISCVTPALVSDVSDELIEMGAKIVLLKLGYLGVHMKSSAIESLKLLGRAAPKALDDWANQELWSPCYQVDVVGTTGSGDATIAGFLSGFLRDLSPIETVDASVAVGACNVEAADALSGLLPWDEVLNRISDGWEKHQMLNHSLEGTWNSEHQVWMLKSMRI
jgi:sugar/nucleoside kinase (ribokinase family)